MVSHAENLVIPAVRHMRIAISLFTSLLLWGSPALCQTPPQVGNGQNPAASTPAAAPPATQGGAGGPAAAGRNTEATTKAKSSLCKGYIEALSGRTQDHAQLNSPQVQQLAHRVPDLVTCAAIKGDSQALCNSLSSGSSEAKHPSREVRACIATQAMFHEARTYPKGHAYMFTDVDRKECEGPFCDALQSALRSGDEKKCAAAGWAQSYCRAYFRLDKSLCHFEGKASKEKHEGGGTHSVDDGCKETIDARAFFGPGLEALAKSGSPREREFAKAALGQADACSSFEQAAMDTCTAHAPGPPSATGVMVGTPVPAAAKPE